MIEHDSDVGKLLKALDDLGIANNTIVIYTTDNGPNQFPGRTRDHAVPQRERYQLGRGVPRARDGALAGSHQGGSVLANVSPVSTGSPRCSRRPATARSRIDCSKEQTLGHDLQSAPRRL